MPTRYEGYVVVSFTMDAENDDEYMDMLDAFEDDLYGLIQVDDVEKFVTTSADRISKDEWEADAKNDERRIRESNDYH